MADSCCNGDYEAAVLQQAFHAWRGFFWKKLRKAVLLRKNLEGFEVGSEGAGAAHGAHSALDLRVYRELLHRFEVVLREDGPMVPCHAALLQYIAGVLCFSCRTEWFRYVDVNNGTVRLRIRAYECDAVWSECAPFSRDLGDLVRALEQGQPWTGLVEAKARKDSSVGDDGMPSPRMADIADLQGFFASRERICSWLATTVGKAPLRDEGWIGGDLALPRAAAAKLSLDVITEGRASAFEASLPPLNAASHALALGSTPPPSGILAFGHRIANLGAKKKRHFADLRTALATVAVGVIWSAGVLLSILLCCCFSRWLLRLTWPQEQRWPFMPLDGFLPCGDEFAEEEGSEAGSEGSAGVPLRSFADPEIADVISDEEDGGDKPYVRERMKIFGVDDQARAAMWDLDDDGPDRFGGFEVELGPPPQLLPEGLVMQQQELRNPPPSAMSRSQQQRPPVHPPKQRQFAVQAQGVPDLPYDAFEADSSQAIREPRDFGPPWIGANPWASGDTGFKESHQGHSIRGPSDWRHGAESSGLPSLPWPELVARVSQNDVSQHFSE